MTAQTALIVGAGPGLSAALARLLAREGFQVALAARNTAKLSDLVNESGARAYACDVSQAPDVTRLFEQVDADLGAPDLVVFNAGGRYRGPFEELDPAKVHETYMVGTFGGFLVAQAAAKRMLERGSGSIFFTGATASVKSLPQSTPFAMSKFALRALAQGLARELAPKNIHVAHFIIDGGIAGTGAGRAPDESDKWLDPGAIAENYLHLHRQHRSAWTWEVELRPWVERF